jgi:two-component system, sensor histidine kinase
MPRTNRRLKSARPGRKRARKAAPDHRATETALAALAHDIRTPLTGILALAELLAAAELGDRERGWASGIKSAAEHLSQLTTIVCDAVKANAVGLTLRHDLFSPRRLAEAASASLSARAETSGLNSEFTIDGDLPANVIGDPVRLRAAIENLIDNAVKFTARGTVKLDVSAAPAANNRARLTFIVADSGIGLSPAELRKLFKPFSQGSEAVARRYGGTGLGLTLVKRLAKAMGGDLKVTSRPGRGSTFALTVLAERINDATRRPRKAPQAGDGHGKRNAELNILCAEDNPYGRVVLSTILSELGHRTDFVSSGEAAVAAVARGKYDAVLMDVTLSGLDGLEATRRIRAISGRHGQIPVIGLSALSGAQDEARARGAGMTAYLAKPVSPATLAETLDKVRQ